MKKVILDTSFILSCVDEKIDFIHELELKGFGVLIPVQVLRELEGVVNSRKKLKFRENAKLALNILKRSKFRKIDLKTQNVDNGIIRFGKKNPSVIVGTLDREIKRRTENQKMVVRGKKKLDIV